MKEPVYNTGYKIGKHLDTLELSDILADHPEFLDVTQLSYDEKKKSIRYKNEDFSSKAWWYKFVTYFRLNVSADLFHNVAYAIAYENNEKEPLEDIELTLQESANKITAGTQVSLEDFVLSALSEGNYSWDLSKVKRKAIQVLKNSNFTSTRTRKARYWVKKED